MVEDIVISLLNFCGTFSEEHGLGMTVLNLDDHIDETTWPTADFIGPSEITVTARKAGILVEGLIVVSTRDDKNLFRLNEIGNKLFKRMLPNNNIPLRDPLYGKVYGSLGILDGVQAMAPMKTKTQPVRAIGFQALSSVMP